MIVMLALPTSVNLILDVVIQPFLAMIMMLVPLILAVLPEDAFLHLLTAMIKTHVQLILATKKKDVYMLM
jgi:hypothetical protein